MDRISDLERFVFFTNLSSISETDLSEVPDNKTDEFILPPKNSLKDHIHIQLKLPQDDIEPQKKEVSYA